jgi:hypothetical protein
MTRIVSEIALDGSISILYASCGVIDELCVVVHGKEIPEPDCPMPDLHVVLDSHRVDCYERDER